MGAVLFLCVVLALSFDREESRFDIKHCENVILPLMPWRLFTRARERWEESHANFELIRNRI